MLVLNKVLHIQKPENGIDQNCKMLSFRQLS